MAAGQLDTASLPPSPGFLATCRLLQWGFSLIHSRGLVKNIFWLLYCLEVYLQISRFIPLKWMMDAMISKIFKVDG